MEGDYRLFWATAYCSNLSALVPFIVGIIDFKSRSIELKLLCIFCIFAFCLDGLAFFLPRHANDLNNLFRLVEFYFLLLIYRNGLNTKSNKFIISLVGISYTVFFSIELLMASQKQLNSYSITLTSLVFIIFSVRYFYVLMRDLPTAQIQRLPMFWINTAVLTYFAGGLFVFAMRNYLVNTLNDNQTIYWSFHNFLNIGKNLLFAVALWQDLRKPKPI
jgi:hypothetical protein